MEDKNIELEEVVKDSNSSEIKNSSKGKRRRKKPKASVEKIEEKKEKIKEEVKEESFEIEKEVEVTPEVTKEEKECCKDDCCKNKDCKCNNFFKKVFSNKKRLFIVIGAILAIIIAFILFKMFSGTDEISKVDKVLGEDYYAIDCLDTNCDQIAAYSGDPTKETTVTLINKKGEKVAKYSVEYNAEDKISKSPIGIGSNWFIFKKTNIDEKKTVGYSIADKKGNETYSTEFDLSVLNSNLVLMKDTDKGINAYTILDPSGKVLFKNVNDVDTFNDKNIISIEENSTKKVLDSEGNVILNNYYVSNGIYDKEDKLVFLLVKDSKNNAYYYFDINKLKIVGDSFQNYKDNEDGTLTITKKVNNKIVKYTLAKDGSQKEIGEDMTQSEIVAELKKSIDTNKYNIYSTSVYDKNQKYVFVDNLEEKSFGVYEIESKNYTKMYDYKADALSQYSSIYEVSNNNDLNYFQVSCSVYSCEKSLFYVYDLESNKELFKLDNDNLTITNYYQYKDDYKVIKYSYSSNDENYRGKYVLLDADGKELAIATNRIDVVDRDILIGTEATSSIVIYSANEGKVLNNDTSLASKITINKEKYYKYSNDDKTLLVNTDGKEVLNVESKFDIIYSSKVLVYVDGNTVNIFNGATGKIKKYTLKSNEKLNDASGSLLPPYRGALFVNNSVDKVIKVVSSKGSVIKTINNAEIEKLYYNSDENVVIISKAFKGNDTLYGLYIAR